MEHWLVLYVANAVWRIPLVAIAAALAVRIAVLGPNGRHRVWLGALVLAAIVPAAPGLDLLARPSMVASVPVSSIEPSASSSALAFPALVFDAGAERLLALVFALIAVLAAARLVAAWRSATRLAAAAEPVELAPGLVSALATAARAHRIGIPAVRRSDDIAGPAVVGAFRPLILAPRSFFRLGEAEQLAALLHELAHIARRDFAANLICEAIALPGAWHPVIYEIKAGVRRSREIACDAMASAALGSRADYARRLLALAEAFGPPSSAPVGVVALIGGGLEERILHLIGGPARGLNGARVTAAAIVAAALLAPVLILRVAPAVAAPTPARVAPAAIALAPPAPLPPAMAAAPRLASVPPHRPGAIDGVAIRARAPRVVMAANEAAAAQPAPPAPSAAALPALPPAPPEPPAAPAPRVDAAAISAKVEAAMARAQKANAEAMTELRAHSAEMSAAQRAQSEVEVRRAVAEAMAQAQQQVHAALTSEEFRRAMSEARAERTLQEGRIGEQVREQVRQAMAEAQRAMAEAQARLGEAPAD